MDRKWEYISKEIHGQAINDELNMLGQQGWELIQIVGSTFHFKREKQHMKSAPVKTYDTVRQEVLAAATERAAPGEAAQARFLADLDLKEEQVSLQRQWQRGRSGRCLKRRRITRLTRPL
jgi:predicted RNA binding protein YcfA (HicA-like mRNA interferase family)